MPNVSTFATVTLVLMAAGLGLLFVLGVRYTTPDRQRGTRQAIALVCLWMGLSGGLAGAGLLRPLDAMPPRFLLFLLVCFGCAITVGVSALGRRLATLPLSWLLGYQVFRVPVELWLYQMHDEGVIPVQMTFAGSNFDVVSGITGILLAMWSRFGAIPRWLLWTWNLLGLGLLLTIVTIAVLSAPTPLRAFHNEPANTVVTYFPFVWLPAVLVVAALLGHVLLFRRLTLPGDARHRTDAPAPTTAT